MYGLDSCFEVAALETGVLSTITGSAGRAGAAATRQCVAAEVYLGNKLNYPWLRRVVMAMI